MNRAVLILLVVANVGIGAQLLTTDPVLYRFIGALDFAAAAVLVTVDYAARSRR